MGASTIALSTRQKPSQGLGVAVEAVLALLVRRAMPSSLRGTYVLAGATQRRSEDMKVSRSSTLPTRCSKYLDPSMAREQNHRKKNNQKKLE